MSTVKAANLQNTGSGAPVFKNSSGTEIGQLAKAWINFNGTGTVAIRDSFNVSSLTDNGTGKCTITFTNAMANTNYCCITNSAQNDTVNGYYEPRNSAVLVYATGSVQMFTGYSTFVFQDEHINTVSIFGD